MATTRDEIDAGIMTPLINKRVLHKRQIFSISLDIGLFISVSCSSQKNLGNTYILVTWKRRQI